MLWRHGVYARTIAAVVSHRCALSVSMACIYARQQTNRAYFDDKASVASATLKKCRSRPTSGCTITSSHERQEFHRRTSVPFA